MEDNSEQARSSKAQGGSHTLWFFVILFFVVSLIEAGVIAYLLGSQDNKDVTEEVKSVSETFTLNPTLSTPSLPTGTPAPKSYRQVVNKEYLFPLRDQEGNTVSEIKYLLQEYELTNQVVVNYQKAILASDKIVLVVSVEITNEFEIAVNIIARDYLRLSVNNEDKWMAAEMHDDPVEVRAHSTKVTKLGFPIKESDTNLKLQMGEIDGPKEITELEQIYNVDKYGVSP